MFIALGIIGLSIFIIFISLMSSKETKQPIKEVQPEIVEELIEDETAGIYEDDTRQTYLPELIEMVLPDVDEELKESIYHDIDAIFTNENYNFEDNVEIFSGHYELIDNNKATCANAILAYHMKQKELTFHTIGSIDENDNPLWLVNDMLEEKGLESIEAFEIESETDEITIDQIKEKFLKQLSEKLLEKKIILLTTGANDAVEEYFITRAESLERILQLCRYLGFNMTQYL